MSGLMQGKRGLIMGLANDRSLAWGIAKALSEQGAELAFSYQGETMEKRVRPLAEQLGAAFLIDCDVADMDNLDRAFATLKERWESAERNVLLGLREYDLTDAYRSLHGYDTHPVSYLPRDDDASGRRYDHVYVSRGAQAVGCGYHEDWRRGGGGVHPAPRAPPVRGSHKPPPGAPRTP